MCVSLCAFVWAMGIVSFCPEITCRRFFSEKSQEILEHSGIYFSAKPSENMLSDERPKYSDIYIFVLLVSAF